MDCKRIKELIITDFIDKETSPEVNKLVEAHLVSCADCRAFEKALLGRAKKPFSGLPEAEPPEEIWHNIKEAIQQKQSEKSPSLLERLLGFLQDNFAVRKPAFAFSAALVVILAAAVFFQSSLRRSMLVNDYLDEQSRFLASLSLPANGELEQDFNLGSSIETYLF